MCPGRGWFGFRFWRIPRTLRAFRGDSLVGGRWAGVPLPKRARFRSHPHLAEQEAELLELVYDTLRALVGRLLLRVEDELGRRRRLVRI
jgi:hypothetical protein